MQLACIFSNLVAQEWQNLDKIFIETQKYLPKKIRRWVAKMLKLDKNPLVARGAAKFCQRMKKTISLNEEKSGILEKSHVRDL